jgi:CheY-like chemotaxis protein
MSGAKSVLNALLNLLRRRHLGDAGVEQARRMHVEHDIRVAKRQGLPCPYAQEGRCINLRVRCGERQQLAERETPATERLPHSCLYQSRPGVADYTILVVEDNPLAREVAVEYLTSLGVARHRLELAGNVSEARAALTRGKQEGRVFCLVVSDVHLGDEKGYDLVDHLVERNFNSRILLTSSETYMESASGAYLGDHEVMEGEKVVSGFLPKPFSMRDLHAALKSVESQLS